MKWKTIFSEYLFKDNWFKVRREKCETPTGKIVEPYYVYEFTPWVGALAITSEGKVILIKQYRHAIGEICIEIPGGCVDETDSNIADAAHRELLEETGYSFDSIEFLGSESISYVFG
jgi:8-oxo-dGTP pyrophosphatase MutT (NUDIX family)